MPGSGVETTGPGPTPVPPPGRVTITPLSKPLLLALQVLETTFSRPVVESSPANDTKVSEKALPQVSCAPGSKVIVVDPKIFPTIAALSSRVVLPVTQYIPEPAIPAPPVVSVTRTEPGVEAVPTVSRSGTSKIQIGARLPPAARVSNPVN